MGHANDCPNAFEILVNTGRYKTDTDELYSVPVQNGLNLILKQFKC